MADSTRAGGQPAVDDVELSRLLDVLREAFLEDEAAAEAVERGAWMSRLKDGDIPDAVYWEPGGARRVVRAVDLWPLALERRERARRDLALAFAAVHEAAGEDMDPSLVDALCERVQEEGDAYRVVGAMEDYADEHECSVSDESYLRAQDDHARAIQAREEAETDILVHVDERREEASRRPAPMRGPGHPRTPRRSARQRTPAAAAATTESAEGGGDGSGDPPPAGDAPPPEDAPSTGLSAEAVLAALRVAGPETLAAIRDALGIGSPRHEHRDATALGLAAAGLGAAEIADRLGISRQHVYRLPGIKAVLARRRASDRSSVRRGFRTQGGDVEATA